MFANPNTDILKCPITCDLFHEPVTGQDGHTYERNAIIEWLQKNGTSPMTREPMSIDSLRPNHTVKQLVDEFKASSSQSRFSFKLDVDIRKAKKKPIFQAPGKTIFEAEWISKKGPAVILLKIEGAKAKREASYYVQLGCHPHIVHTYGMVENEFNALMLVQEYATEGDLGLLLKEKEFQPSQAVLIEIFLQIIDAMIYLAEYGIVHGDLACRNVLVYRFHNSDPQENLVKLTDFGLTRASTLYAIIGTSASTTLTLIPIRYAAPEILQHQSNYSEKSDVYSMGILMWEACSQGQLPYPSIEDDNEVCRHKLEGEIQSQPDNCDDDLWNIIVQCWNQQPEARPTFKMLKTSMLNLQNRSKTSSNDIPSNNMKNQMSPTVGNTTDNQVELQTQISSSVQSSVTSKLNTHLDELLFIEAPETMATINCEFCNNYLPSLGRSLHDQTLTELILHKIKINNEQMEHIGQVLKENKTLLKLELVNNGIAYEGILHLAKALRINETLLTVEISYNPIQDKGAQCIAEALSTYEGAQQLNNILQKYTEKYAARLAETIRVNQTLTYLSLQHVDIGPEGAKHIAAALKQNQTLIILNLSDNNIGDVGAKYLAATLGNNKSLTTLNLSANHISATGMQCLEEALKNNKTLTRLVLRGNNIGTGRTQYFEEDLRNNQILTTVDLRLDDIRISGAKHLAEKLRNNQLITTSELTETRKSDERTQHLLEPLHDNQTFTTVGEQLKTIDSI